MTYIFAILYANFVEYAVHRWFLHRGDARHAEHHARPWPTGLLVSHPAVWAAMFAHVAGAFLLGYRAVSVVWALYIVLLEAAHYSAHRWPGTWFAAWHISHHVSENRRFNVFLPMWDWILGTTK